MSRGADLVVVGGDLGLLVPVRVQQHPALLQQHGAVAVDVVERPSGEVAVHVVTPFRTVEPPVTRDPQLEPDRQVRRSSRRAACIRRGRREVVMHAHLGTALAALGDRGAQPGARARYHGEPG